jgi:hypothetical protein
MAFNFAAVAIVQRQFLEKNINETYEIVAEFGALALYEKNTIHS